MEYISAEEFLKQPVGVQRVFLEWWKPSKGDLIQKVITDFITFVRDGDNKRVLLSGYSYGIDRFKELYILLPTEGQLRQFIEDKTGCIIDISYSAFKGKGYCIQLNQKHINSKFGLSMRFIKQFENLGENLLQAYWKVACKIAKECK